MSRAFVVFAAPLLLAWGGTPLEFAEEELSSSNGSALLTWSDDADEYAVQRDSDPAFANPQHVYRGRMPSAHVSGLRDGTYYFRVQALDGDTASSWSRPARLDVEHHSMALVWPLFTMGALVFLGTAGFVARHARDPDGSP